MSDLTIAQDPRELFDIVTPDGVPTGIRKARADVHRDGDWHRSVHVWVTGVGDEGPFLTFQQRSLTKDTCPGMLDATVGGHYRAGERPEETLRETEEEIGVAVDLAQLHYAGVRICINEAEEGVRDRELQDIFFLRDDRPLTEFRPNPAELTALVRFPLLELMNLFAGDIGEVTGRSLAPGATELEWVNAKPSDFIIRIDRYFYRVAVAAERLLAGARHIVV